MPKLRSHLYNALPDGIVPANGETETQTVIASWKSADGSLVRIRAKSNFSLDARGLLAVIVVIAREGQRLPGIFQAAIQFTT